VAVVPERRPPTAARSQAAGEVPVMPLLVMGDMDWRGTAEMTAASPWDGTPVARIPQISPDELRRALDWGAERAPRVAAWPVADRIAAIERWADLIDEHAEALAVSESRDMGKVIRQARKNIPAIAARLRVFAAQAAAVQDVSYPTTATRTAPDVLAFSVRDPLGLVVGILPFNSPVGALTWKIVPALLMGNAVLIKVSSLAPVSALRAAHLLDECGLPEGALQVVSGPGERLADVIARHPDVRKISLTGGTPAGIKLWQATAESMKRLTLECSSNDPAIVLGDADIAHAAKAICGYAFTIHNGQLCTAPKRVLVAQGVHDAFVEALTAEAAALRVGDPLDDATDVGPLVREDAAADIEQQVAAGVAAGGRLVAGGRRTAPALLPPTIVDGVTPDNPLWREGPFGPVTSITTFRDEDEAVRLANDSPYALRAAIFATDVNRATRLARGLDFGGVAINGPTTIGDHFISVDPRKQSGVGSEGVLTSLMEYSQPKFIWINGWW
jgi:gamma-glutamyl-gamma-aminobutyraldehyde dehydrogenase